MLAKKLTEQEKYYADRDAYYGSTGEDFVQNERPDLKHPAALLRQYGRDALPSDVKNCPMNEAQMLLYTPVSDGARRMGRLHRYDRAEKRTGTLTLGGTTLRYSVPVCATAYDAVPITYSVTGTRAALPLHISATTFEDPTRYADPGASYFDCNLPGKAAVTFTYNGYVAGNLNPDDAPNWGHDLHDVQGKKYPAYDVVGLTRSGTLPARDDIIWLNFSYRNTGNTILDSEGNGAFCFKPLLEKKDENGIYQKVLNLSTDNYMQRLYDYLYPGEEGSMWLLFLHKHASTEEGRYRYTPGEYRVILQSELRNEREANGWRDNYVGGRVCGRAYFTFTVTEQGAVTEPDPIWYSSASPCRRNRWIGSYEEFQSSYQTLTAAALSADAPVTGTIYVQPAPWNQMISLKIMHGDLGELAAVQLPLAVKSDSVSLALNPYNENYHIKPDGTREPLLVTQSMIDMRGNIQMGPDALHTGINDLRNMKAAGINLLTSTMSFSYDSHANDSYKFMMDAARVLGFELEGFSNYPYNSGASVFYATAIRGSLPGGSVNGWGNENMNEANGILADYTLKRYGDLFWMREDGALPIAAEDTWGWLTIDHDWRFGLIHDASIRRYQKWLQTVYPDIQSLNAAYGSDYASFAEIDPRKDAILDETVCGSYDFTRSTGVYRERSRAMAELDVYRTLSRLEDYRTMLHTADIPGSKLWIRYEGSTWFAPGISPATANPHYRQFYYEQRRNAVIPEILATSDVVFGGSNYDGVPLTPTESYEMTRYSTLAGLTMSKLPMISHMRDILINPVYGNRKFVVDYNLKDDSLKGACMDTTIALFPYLKSMYEGGGIPGVMWQDYFCDGFITSTQYQELQFYTKKVREMLATDEGRSWATKFEAPPRTFEQKAQKVWSYPREYIERVLSETPRDCHFEPPEQAK